MRTIKWELFTSSIHFLTMSILLSFVCLWSRSVIFDSWRPHGLQPTRLLCLWPGIFQARVLEWVAISFSRRSSWPRDRTQVSHIVGRHLTIWATREVAFYYFFCLFVYVTRTLPPVCQLMFLHHTEISALMIFKLISLFFRFGALVLAINKLLTLETYFPT